MEKPPVWVTVDEFKPKPANEYLKSHIFLPGNHRNNKLKQKNETPSLTADKRNIALLVHSLAVAETKRNAILEKSASLQDELDKLKICNKELTEQHQCTILFSHFI